MRRGKEGHEQRGASRLRFGGSGHVCCLTVRPVVKVAGRTLLRLLCTLADLPLELELQVGVPGPCEPDHDGGTFIIVHALSNRLERPSYRASRRR